MPTLLPSETFCVEKTDLQNVFVCKQPNAVFCLLSAHKINQKNCAEVFGAFFVFAYKLQATFCNAFRKAFRCGYLKKHVVNLRFVLCAPCLFEINFLQVYHRFERAKRFCLSSPKGGFPKVRLSGVRRSAFFACSCAGACATCKHIPPFLSRPRQKYRCFLLGVLRLCFLPRWQKLLRVCQSCFPT